MAKKREENPAIKELKQKISAILIDRSKFEISLFVIFAVVMIGGLYYPVKSKYDEVRAKYTKQRTHLHLAEDITNMRRYYSAQDKVVSKEFDKNQWSEHILEGLRKFSIKLRSFEHRTLKRKIDKYQVLFLKLEVEGTFQTLYEFFHWLEFQRPAVLVSSVNLSRAKESILAKTQISVFANWKEKRGTRKK